MSYDFVLPLSWGTSVHRTEKSVKSPSPFLICRIVLSRNVQEKSQMICLFCLDSPRCELIILFTLDPHISDIFYSSIVINIANLTQWTSRWHPVEAMTYRQNKSPHQYPCEISLYHVQEQDKTIWDGLTHFPPMYSDNLEDEQNIKQVLMIVHQSLYHLFVS